MARSPFLWAFKADVHPPLFYAWFFPLRSIASRPEVLRPLSALMGAVAVLPILLILAGSASGRRVPLLGGLLFALSPLRVQVAHLARSYSFLLLFEALALFFAVRAYERGGRGWGLYALFSTLAILTHGLALLTLLGRLFFFGFWARRRREARRLIAASGVPLFAFLLWALLHGLPGEPPSPPGLKGALSGLILSLEEPSTYLVTSFWRAPGGVQRLLFALWPAFSGLAVWGALRGRPGLLVCLFSWLGGGVALAFLCGLGRMVVLAVYTLVLLPGFLVCLAEGMGRVLRLSPRVGAVLSALALLLHLGGATAYLMRGGDNIDWRRVAREAERLADVEGRGAIICRPPAAASVLRFYVRSVPVLPEEPVIMVVAGVGRQVLPWGEPYRGETKEAVKALRFGRLVLVNWLWKFPVEPEVPGWVEGKGYKRIRRKKVTGYTQHALIEVYERKGLKVSP